MQNRHWRAHFLAFWTTQALSLLGSGLASFALVWWMTRTTQSASVLALAALAGLLPSVIVGPFAGALVDRWNRRWVLILSDGVSAMMAAALVVLFWSGAVELWVVYLLLALRSVAGAFQFPAVQSSTTLMVPTEQLARVAGLNQALQGLMLVAVAPLAALLLERLPLPIILAADVVGAALAMALLGFITIPQPGVATIAAGRSALQVVWQDVRDGLRYIVRWPALLGILLFASLLNLVLTPAFALLPILVTRHFHGGAVQLASLNAAYGLGFLAGGLLLGVWGGFRRRIATSLMGLLGLASGAVLLGLAPAGAFWLGLGGMALIGVMNPLTNGPFFAILQSVVAPEMQGRVFTVMMSVSLGLSPLGLAVAGPLADRLGVQVWYLLGGAVCLLIALYIILSPALLRLEENRRADMPPTVPQAAPVAMP
jgi:DHA3 family macrolide efflux protein-like MFS transporter